MRIDQINILKMTPAENLYKTVTAYAHFLFSTK